MLRYKITLIFQVSRTREAYLYANLLRSARDLPTLRKNQVCVLGGADSNNVNSRLINLVCNMLDYTYAQYSNERNIGISNKYAALKSLNSPRQRNTMLSVPRYVANKFSNIKFNLSSTSARRTYKSNDISQKK